MAQNIIAYFCGTGYYTSSDACYQHISRTIADSTALYGFDGCQVKGGGIFAHGVEEYADELITQLQKHTGEIQLNLIGHSRGVLSALLVVKKVQADPELSNRCIISADFRDPVPGNFQLTAKVVGSQAIANQVRDLSQCTVLKNVFITLQEIPILPIAFDAVIPKFHAQTEVEIETLPGYHDVQQRTRIDLKQEHPEIFKLGLAKTMAVLLKDGNVFIDNISLDSLARQQLEVYNLLVDWAKKRKKTLQTRSLHHKGSLLANNASTEQLTTLNWRHARLLHENPTHVLFASNHPHYNHLKSTLELYCDLTLALDNYLEKNPASKNAIEALKKLASEYQQNIIDSETFRKKTIIIQNTYHLTNKKINASINYLLMQSYFTKLDTTIADNVPHESELHDRLQVLKTNLYEELMQFIEAGINIAELPHSKPVSIANNTAEFITSIYSQHLTVEEVIDKAQQYAKDNCSLGHNWPTVGKIIAGSILMIAATVAGCVIGAVIGFSLGVYIGAITGPADVITAFIGAFIGVFAGAMIALTATGALTGIGVGAYGAYHFFKPSAVEDAIIELTAATVMTN